MKKVLVIGVVTILLLLLIPSVSATWCNNDYGKKTPILINNTGGSEQTYYQVMLNYTHDSDMNANFSDARVYNESDCSLIPLWNESAITSSWNQIWFNATNIPASLWCNDTYYLYYDYSSASSVSNITTTFLFGDEFSDGTYEGEDGVVSSFGSWTRNRASFIVGDYAYCTHNTGLKVISISDIENPTEVGSVTLGGAAAQVLDIEVSGNYAFISVLGDDELAVVNISNATNPVEVGNVSDATKLNQIHGINLSGNFVYCCAYDGGTGGDFTIVDISDPTNPTIRGTIANDANNYIKGAHDVKVIGDYAYLIGSNHNVNNDGRFTSINISDPDNPFVVDSITGNEFHQCSDIAIKENYAYFGTRDTSTLGRYIRVLSISDPSNLALAGYLQGYAMYVGYLDSPNDLLYTVHQHDDHLNVIDISTPTSPTFVKEYLVPDSSLSVSHVFLTPDGSYSLVSRYDDSTGKKFYMIDNSVTPTEGWAIANSETGDSASAATYELVMTKGTTAGTFDMTRNTATQLTTKHVWSVLVKYASGDRANLILNGDNANPISGAIYLAFGRLGGAEYYDGSYHTIHDTIDADVFYKIDIVPDVSTDTFDIYIYKNGVEVIYSGSHTGLNFRNVATYLNQWRPSTGNANDVSTYDNFIVRKHTSPEPTASLGTEESPSATYTPPNPTNLQHTDGNFWVNYTWDAGDGNVTNYYNVSNGTTWNNDSSNTYFNESLEASEWLNITVYAWNSSGGGTLSAGSVSDQQQAPSVSTKKFYETSTSDFSAEVAVIDLYTSRDGTANNVAYELATGNLYNYINATSNITVGQAIKIPAGTKVNFSAYFDDGDRVDYAYATWKFYRLVGASTTLICQKGDDGTGGVQIPDGTTETITGYCSVTSDVTLNSTDKVRLIMNVWAETIGNGGAATKVATHYWDSTHESWVEYKYQLTTTDTTFTVSLPVGYTKPVFEPPNSTATNYPPNGQTSSQEFFNVTNSGNVNLDVRMRLNTTVSTITLKADADNNPTGADTIGTSLVTIHSNLGQGSSVGVWLWSDFDHTPAQTANRTVHINVSQS